jgi:hypothetical protein
MPPATKNTALIAVRAAGKSIVSRLGIVGNLQEQYRLVMGVTPRLAGICGIGCTVCLTVLLVFVAGRAGGQPVLASGQPVFSAAANAAAIPASDLNTVAEVASAPVQVVIWWSAGQPTQVAEAVLALGAFATDFEATHRARLQMRAKPSSGLGSLYHSLQTASTVARTALPDLVLVSQTERDLLLAAGLAYPLQNVEDTPLALPFALRGEQKSAWFWLLTTPDPERQASALALLDCLSRTQSQ